MANPIKSVEQAFNSAIEAVTGILKTAFSTVFTGTQRPEDENSDFRDPSDASDPTDFSDDAESLDDYHTAESGQTEVNHSFQNNPINPNLKTEVFTSFKTEVPPEISNKESQDRDEKETQDLMPETYTTQYDKENQSVQNSSPGTENTPEPNPTQKLITDIHTILRKKK